MQIFMICWLIFLQLASAQMYREGSTAATQSVDKNASSDVDVPEVMVNQSSIDSELLDIMWCGNGGENQTILIISEKGTLYKSTNQGKELINMRKAFAKLGSTIANDEVIFLF